MGGALVFDVGYPNIKICNQGCFQDKAMYVYVCTSFKDEEKKKRKKRLCFGHGHNFLNKDTEK